MPDLTSEQSIFEYLVHAFLMLQTPDECRSFLHDLCTESELQEMSRRLQAAIMLKAGYIYTDIADKTGLSTATISLVDDRLGVDDVDARASVGGHGTQNGR